MPARTHARTRVSACRCRRPRRPPPRSPANVRFLIVDVCFAEEFPTRRSRTPYSDLGVARVRRVCTRAPLIAAPGKRWNVEISIAAVYPRFCFRVYFFAVLLRQKDAEDRGGRGGPASGEMSFALSPPGVSPLVFGKPQVISLRMNKGRRVVRKPSVFPTVLYRFVQHSAPVCAHSLHQTQLLALTEYCAGLPMGRASPRTT